MKETTLIILIISAIFALYSLEQKAEDVFEQAVLSYESRDYEEALDLFLQLDNENITNADLYYNIGNCYYRLQKSGLAILNYQKALKINPLHQSAKRDLNYALSNIQDKVNAENEDAVSRLWNKVYHSLPLNLLAYLSFGFFLIIIIILHWIILQYRGREKTVPIFILTIIIFLFTLVFILGMIRWNGYKNINNGVLLSSTTIGYSGPSPEFTRMFTIHEGMIFQIVKQENEWSLIKLPNGIGGWIRSADYGNVSVD